MRYRFQMVGEQPTVILADGDTESYYRVVTTSRDAVPLEQLNGKEAEIAGLGWRVGGVMFEQPLLLESPYKQVVAGKVVRDGRIAPG